MAGDQHIVVCKTDYDPGCGIQWDTFEERLCGKIFAIKGFSLTDCLQGTFWKRYNQNILLVSDIVSYDRQEYSITENNNCLHSVTKKGGYGWYAVA
jgi:hypothetical protein